MKKFIGLLSLVLMFTAQNASAQQYVELREGDQFLSAMDGQVTGAKRLCPEGMVCVTDGTTIDLNFTLGGCMDSLGPVSYKAVPAEDGALDVFVSAVNVHNKQSLVAFCFVMPTAQETVTLIGQVASDVRVHFLGTNTVVSAAVDQGQSQGECFAGGCSGQVCSDQPGAISTCEFLPEYACYDQGSCERQTDGQCGWTQTPELLECISEARGEDECFVGGCSGQYCSDEPGLISTCEWRAEYACYGEGVCQRQMDGQCGWTQTPELVECLTNPGNL